MNATILLVEDSPDDVFFMKRALKLANVTNPLHVAEDGQMALDYLEGKNQFAAPHEFPLPGLILLDLRLPRVPGFEVLQCVRKQAHLKCVPIVVLTSSREERDMQKAYELGANSFLVKSPDTAHLTDMVKCLCDYWLKFNEVPVFCTETDPANKILD